MKMIALAQGYGECNSSPYRLRHGTETGSLVNVFHNCFALQKARNKTRGDTRPTLRHAAGSHQEPTLGLATAAESA